MARKTTENGSSSRSKRASNNTQPSPLQAVPETRRNLVPINLEDEIRRRAFELYQQRGANPGSERDDWLVAEREVRERYQERAQLA